MRNICFETKKFLRTHSGQKWTHKGFRKVNYAWIVNWSQEVTSPQYLLIKLFVTNRMAHARAKHRCGETCKESQFLFKFQTTLALTQLLCFPWKMKIIALADLIANNRLHKRIQRFFVCF